MRAIMRHGRLAAGNDHDPGEEKKMDEQTPDGPARRHFLKRVAGATTVLPFAGAAAIVGDAAAQTPAATTTTAAPAVAPILGYASFSPDEAAFVEALVNLMCPADQYTPNGVDCGLATFIDRQLAGDFGRGAKRYLRGPWGVGKPQHGYQLPMTPEGWFKAGLEAANAASVAKKGKTFDRLSAADADAFLTDLSTGKLPDAEPPLAPWFNELVYPLFQQACFADPMYGGNYDKVFWKMIGYPGLPATNTVNMVQYRGKPFPGSANPKSIADFS
jgi:gluconate 2-dehydrogenase gamma chain